MPGNFKKNDLRVIKTYKSLLSSLTKLLASQNFNRLTVNDICEGAQLSRTAFYMHFLDKYDLLKYFLNDLKTEIATNMVNHEMLNKFIANHRRLVINLVEDADYMTTEILQEFIVAVVRIPISDDGIKPSNKQIVLANFCAGGVINCIMWQIKKSFPIDLQMANVYIAEILKLLRKWGNE